MYFKLSVGINDYEDFIQTDAAINPGTIILQVSRKPVKTANEFSREINKVDKDKGVLLLIRSGDMQRYVLLSW